MTSFEQGGKSGLLKMFVAGQRVDHVPLAHDDKRNAIGQRPALVRVLVIQLQRAVQPFSGCGNDFAGGCSAQMQDEFAHPSATFGFSQRVGNFHEHPVGRQQAGTKVAGEFLDLFVMLIPAVQPRHKIKGIGKDDAYGREWP